MFNRSTLIVLSAVAVLMLLAGIPTGLPYDYYVFLRWVICGIAVFSAYSSYEIQKQSWALVMIVIAILFNPIIPIYLSKSTWVIIDLIAAILFVSNIFLTKESVGEPNELSKV